MWNFGGTGNAKGNISVEGDPDYPVNKECFWFHRKEP